MPTDGPLTETWAGVTVQADKPMVAAVINRINADFDMVFTMKPPKSIEHAVSSKPIE